MPKGSKTCSSCGTSNGPRSFVCKSCGASFSFKSVANPTPIRSFKPSSQATVTPNSNAGVVSFNSRGHRRRTILIPRGECPVKLTDLTPEGVIIWSEKIRSLDENVVYTYTALEYWMRDFVDPRTNPELFEELTSVIA